MALKPEVRMFFMGNINRSIILMLVAVLVLAACGGAEERKAKYLERGKDYFEKQNYDKARVEFKNVLQIDPKTSEPYYYLGQIAEKNQQWRQAYNNYSKAVEFDPELVTARIKLGGIYLMAGDLEKAEYEISEALSREPENYDALTARASLLMRREMLGEAIDIATGVLEKEPGHPAMAMLLAAVYEQQERPDEALQILEAAKAANSENVNLQLMLAQAYLKNNENEKAKQILQDLINVYPDIFQYRLMLASYYAQAKQYDDAEKVLRDAIAADPEDVQRYKMLIEFFIQNDLRDKAVAELEAAVEAKPGLTELRFALAQLHLQSEQIDKAEGIYMQLIDELGMEPDGIKARTALAELRLEQDKVDEAKALIEEVLEENAKDNQALFLKGRIALDEKDYPGAVAAFRSILKDLPESVEVLTMLAMAHEANGEKELALDNLSRAVKFNPNDINARLRLTQMLAGDDALEAALEQVNAALEVDPASLLALRAKAEILARQGHTEELEEVLTQIEKVSPETGMGAFGKGMLYSAQKRYTEAVAAYEEALAREPNSVLTLTLLVNTELTMGNTDSAIARLKHILVDNPDNRIAHGLLGVAYMNKQDFTAAEEEFMKQLKIAPNSSIVYTQIANARGRQGKLDGAEQILQQGLGVLSDDPRLLLALASLYVANDDLYRAVQTLEKGMAAAPDEPDFALRLAGIHEREGRYEEAISTYEKLLERKPDNFLAVNNLAALLADYRDDAESLQKAKDLASRLTETGHPALLDTLGWVHYRLGDYDEAATILADVVEKAPEVPVFRYHLGMAYYKLGNKTAAKEELSQAVAEDYSYMGVEEARKAFAELP